MLLTLARIRIVKLNFSYIVRAIVTHWQSCSSIKLTQWLFWYDRLKTVKYLATTNTINPARSRETKPLYHHVPLPLPLLQQHFSSYTDFLLTRHLTPHFWTNRLKIGTWQPGGLSNWSPQTFAFPTYQGQGTMMSWACGMLLQQRRHREAKKFAHQGTVQPDRVFIDLSWSEAKSNDFQSTSCLIQVKPPFCRIWSDDDWSNRFILAGIDFDFWRLTLIRLFCCLNSK